MTNTLIAAAQGFKAAEFARRKLKELKLSEFDSLTVVCDESSVIPSLLDELGIRAEALKRVDPKDISRQRARELVRDADNVMVFWDGSTLSHLIFEAKRMNKPLILHPIEITRVVNRNKDAFDTYIGRGTPWGNPYRVGSGPEEFSREEAISRFRQHFFKNILGDELLLRRLLALRGDRLGCSCKPLACHGDVIAEYLNALDPEHLPSPTALRREAGKQVDEIGPKAAQPTHLFISYAIEDSLLAGWLARKLATFGYAVWFDQIKLLGGEAWPTSIDLAIKERTFRMLALLSRNSIHKQNPTKERTLALAIAKQRKIDDFLITLKVDNAQLDWLTSDISYIPFNHGWADGLRRLLKKLEAIDAPRVLKDPRSLAAHSIPQGDELITKTPETLRANVIPVTEIPAVLRAYRTNDVLSESDFYLLSSKWPSYSISPDYFISFFAPPSNTPTKIQPTKEQWSWEDVPRIKDVFTRNIVAHLVLRTIATRLLQGGFSNHPKQRNVFYLPKDYTPNGLLHYIDYRNKRTWLKIQGSATFLSPGKPREKVHHNFSVRLSLGRGLGAGYWIALTPTLFFFDSNGEPIVDKRVGPRRRRLTKNWWNNKWMNRLLALEQLLMPLAPAGQPISLSMGLHKLESPLALDELALEEGIGDTEDEELIVEEASQDSLEEVEELEDVRTE